jgi:hypothetical protein
MEPLVQVLAMMDRQIRFGAHRRPADSRRADHVRCNTPSTRYQDNRGAQEDIVPADEDTGRDRRKDLREEYGGIKFWKQSWRPS